MKLNNKQINTIFTIILAACVVITAAVVLLLHRDGVKADAEPVFLENTTEKPVRPDGFFCENKEWYYYENGSKTQKDGLFSGTVKGKEGNWYVRDSKVDFSYNALINKGGNNYLYVVNGEASEINAGEALNKVSERLKEPTEQNVFSLHGSYQLSEKAREALGDAVKQIENKGYKVGLMVMELGSLTGFSYNADESIYSASTIKGPYVASLVKYDNSVLEKEKNSITAILEKSSNGDYSSLRNRYGDECFVDWAKKSGSDFEVSTTDIYQFITPRQLAHLWLNSYFFFESGDVGKQLGGMFENPETSPIHSVLSQKYKTRTKAGWVSVGGIHVTNDAGIVYAGEKTYLVSIMTTAPCNFYIVENLVKAMDVAISG